MASSFNLDLNTAGVAEISRALLTKQVSAEELAHAGLAKVGASQLNSFIDVQPELTLAQARAADTRLAAGETGALLGIPMAHKDIFVTQGWRSTAGSKMLSEYVSPYNATVVDKLIRAGAVSLGKLNCDEFAMGSSNENSYFGPVANPWDLATVPGGSSGGSAAAVAGGLIPIATGTDTGGSVRQPAALCGITGIKPTYGRVSRFGMIAFASSLDQGGAMARRAEDCALLLTAMAGFDERDSTSLQREPENFDRSLQVPIKSAGKAGRALRVGIPKEFFGPGLAADVRQAIEVALKQFTDLGAEIIEVSLPKTELAIPAYYVIAPAEASSNLSRFDGVRYGFRAKEYGDLNDMYTKSRSQGFGEEVKRRILVGSYVLCAGYYDAYYLKAQKLRRLIAEDFAKVFELVDVIAGPVSPTVAWKMGEKSDDQLKMYLADIYTLPASLAGLPGMSIPVGFGAGGLEKGLPVGLQLIGNYFEESQLLGIAHQYQQATSWHLQTPLGRDGTLGGKA
jgi:aspartyl-tRNA(Asn)/glutamyl-tRNA(Gln) amidotransferase subunit A